MTPLAHCRQEIAPTYSDWFYALKGRSGEPGISALLGMLCFIQRVNRIAHQASNQELAHTQLQWWQQQLANDASTPTTHPSLALLSHCSKTPYVHSRLQRLIELAYEDVAFGGFAQPQDLQRFLRTRGALQIELITRVLGEEISAAVAADWGYFIEFVQLLRQLPYHASQGVVYFSEQTLSEFDLLPEHFGNTNQLHAHQRNISALLTQQSDLALSALQKATQLIDKNRRRQLQVLYRWTALQKSWLDAIRTDDFPVFEYQIDLGSLRKKWICLKTSLFHFS